MWPGPIVSELSGWLGLTPAALVVLVLIYAGLAAATLIVRWMTRSDPARGTEGGYPGGNDRERMANCE
jgi:hypothetical protein